MIHLSDLTLRNLPRSVKQPRYDRSSLTPGIVHIGVGNFHRAHQGWYLQQLFNLGIDRDWAVIGAGVRRYDAKQREKFLKQNCLSTLIELTPKQKAAEVVGSMIDYVPVDHDNSALVRKMADPSIRIISLTVTDSGYYFDSASGKLQLSHPDIVNDTVDINRPKTAFGSIVSALKARRDKGLGPFTCQSCDNLPGNGEILREIIISIAERVDPSLAQWIGTYCTFPRSMVDCIVPQTSQNELELVRSFGIDDLVPVTHENFRQWVVEDEYCAGRPHWEQAGVMFSSRVHDYESMKLRILNAGHQVVANAGEVMAIHAVADCMNQRAIREMFYKLQREDIIPLVIPVPDISPQDYLELIARRFSNSAMCDTTRRVSFDGASRHSKFVLPIVREALQSNSSIKGLALTEAIWARMCEGTREDGSEIEPNDPRWNELQHCAKAARTRPRAWLEQSWIYDDLAEVAEFVKSFEFWLNHIWSKGCKSTLHEYLCD